MIQLINFVFALSALGGLPKFDVQEIETGLDVGYAVRVADVNGDGKPDIIVLDSKRVIWYENPTWKPRVVFQGQTPPDNVCMAPLDINGDGKLDLAIGAGWQKSDNYTHNLFWLEQTSLEGPWRLHQIGSSPYVHRMQWIDVVGDDRPDLVVVPLTGVGKTPADRQTNPVSIMAFEIPLNPATGRWKEHLLSNQVHVSHNFLERRWPIVRGNELYISDHNYLTRPGELLRKRELVVASFEGLTSFTIDKKKDEWVPNRILTGDQKSNPNKGCSEVAVARRKRDMAMFGTIEPWHGNQVVVYTKVNETQGWNRTIVDDQLLWGHAIAFADLDGDGNDELIAGVRDDKSPEHRRGIRLYSFLNDEGVVESKERLDPGSVAVEDLAVADLNGDGRPDIVVSGRQTHNVRIYWNRGK